MTTERIVRAVAGSFVLLSLALGYFASPYWLLLTAFVGLNLFQSSLTGWCPLEVVIVRLGVRTQAATGQDRPAVVSNLLDEGVDRASPLATTSH